MSRLTFHLRRIGLHGTAFLLASLPLTAAAQTPMLPYDGVEGGARPAYAPGFQNSIPGGGQTGDPFATSEPNPLPNLPRPADQPRSLFQPALGGTPYCCQDNECPYLQQDPLLDCCGTARPGWLFDVELDYLGSHVFDHVGQFAQPPAVPVPFQESVPMAHLDWKVSPRFELGYRLPSGFGELDFAYRFLLATGSGTTSDPSAAPDGTATLLSHLQLREADLDYARNETSLETMLGPGYGMKWRIGLRTADAIFNSRADEPLAETIPPGSGFFERSISNHFWGIGPHVAVELGRRWNDYGLGVVCRLDGGLLFGRVTQELSQLSTAPGGNEAYSFNNLQQVPMLGGFLGLDWCPASCPKFDFQLGYTAEYWWNVGRLSDPNLYNSQSAGEFGTSGVSFRVQYNY